MPNSLIRGRDPEDHRPSWLDRWSSGLRAYEDLLARAGHTLDQLGEDAGVMGRSGRRKIGACLLQSPSVELSSQDAPRSEERGSKVETERPIGGAR